MISKKYDLKISKKYDLKISKKYDLKKEGGEYRYWKAKNIKRFLCMVF